jgi:nicotinamide mononucleotide transporter
MTDYSVKKFVEGEFSGWKTPEVVWLAFCCLATVILSKVMGDDLIGMISAVTGILYTIIAGKGKMSCYFFGIINTILYGWISWKLRLYGEVMLNWGWYLPMMFTGFFCWNRKQNEKHVVRKTRLSLKGRFLASFSSLCGIALYAVILHAMNGRSPVLDSTTTILSVTAMILTVKRCIEQWVIWTIVNIISIIMWLKVYLENGNSAASLLMWCIALANGIIFFITWSRELEPEEQQTCPTN